LVERAMDEALVIGPPAARLERLALEGEFHDVLGGDAFGRPRARQEIALGIMRVPGADMAEAVDHAHGGKDAIGRNQIFDQFVITRHDLSYRMKLTEPS